MPSIDALIARRFCRPGERVLDAGLHHGNTVQGFLQAGAGSVLGFEPNPDSFQAVRARFRDDRRVAVLPVALGGRDGALPLYEPVGSRGASSIDAHFARHRSDIKREAVRQRVAMVRRLDTLDLYPTTFWKIDIEGSELAFLDGAAQTLASRPPRAGYVEVFGQPIAPPGHQRAVVQRLSRHFRTVRGIGCRPDGEVVLIDLTGPDLAPGAPGHGAMRRAGTPLFYFSNDPV